MDTLLDGWFSRGGPDPLPTRPDPPDGLSVTEHRLSNGGGRGGAGIRSGDEALSTEIAQRMTQEIFAAALELDGAQSLLIVPAVEHVQRAIDHLDAVIRDIRRAVFGQPPLPSLGPGDHRVGPGLAVSPAHASPAT